MQKVENIFLEQQRHDTAVSEIAEIASSFGRYEALAVIDLARARIAIRWAVNDRLESDQGKKNRP